MDPGLQRDHTNVWKTSDPLKTFSLEAGELELSHFFEFRILGEKTNTIQPPNQYSEGGLDE